MLDRRPGPYVFFSTMADGLNELLVAYSSSGSSSEIEDLAQIKSIDSMDVEYCSNHDLIFGNVDSAKKKPKSFGSELQLHNYFSSSARVLTSEEKFHLLKDSDNRI